MFKGERNTISMLIIFWHKAKTAMNTVLYKKVYYGVKFKLFLTRGQNFLSVKGRS